MNPGSNPGSWKAAVIGDRRRLRPPAYLPPAPGGAVSRAARRDVPKGPSEARPLTPTRQVLHPPPDTNLQQTRWLSQPWNDRSRPGTPTPGRPGTPTLGLDSHNPTRRQHVPNSSTPLHRSLETAWLWACFATAESGAARGFRTGGRAGRRQPSERPPGRSIHPGHRRPPGYLCTPGRDATRWD
jgi:hypothetical protein